jgi:hypothetical protein
MMEAANTNEPQVNFCQVSRRYIPEEMPCSTSAELILGLYGTDHFN